MYVKISLIRTKIQYLRWSHEETDRHTNLITKKKKQKCLSSKHM